MFSVFMSASLLFNHMWFGFILLGIFAPLSFFLLQRKIWLRFWVGFFCLQAVTWALKLLLNFPRPFGGGAPLNPGFPSGVAADAGFAAVFLSLQWPRYWWFWHAIGGGIALLRLYAGAHYSMDVVAGYGIGCIAAFLLFRHIKGQ